MINEALKCLALELNEYLKNELRSDSNAKATVLISGIVDQAGQVAVPEEDTIVVTLVNIQEEPVVKNYNLAGSRTTENTQNPFSINLYVLCSACFKASNYEESLKYLGLVISFLQEKNVFTPANSPGLNSNIEKLSIEMVSQGFEELHNLWGTLGAKYMPSVLYKMRMLTFTNSDLNGYRPVITAAN